VMTVWRNRGLIRAMVRRDILGRYRGSFGGAFWTIINPLLLMLTYFFVFGVETLPVNLVCAGLITELFAIVLYCIFLLAINHTLPVALVWLPVLIIPQILFTAGVSWFLAALGVFARDLGQIIGFVLTLWFFLTPICYPENKLPHAAAGVLTKNPMYVL